MKKKIPFSLLVASSLFSCGEEGNESGDGINPFETDRSGDVSDLFQLKKVEKDATVFK